MTVSYMKKIVAWVNKNMQKRILKEFSDSDTTIVFIRSFSNFKEEITDTSLNIISPSNFNDLDSSNFIIDVSNFFKANPNKIFRIFMYLGEKASPLSCGFLSREKNVTCHIISRDYKGTIQARIDANL